MEFLNILRQPQIKYRQSYLLLDVYFKSCMLKIVPEFLLQLEQLEQYHGCAHVLLTWTAFLPPLADDQTLQEDDEEPPPACRS